MDFLDPKKQKAHARRLTLGYALIGLVLLLGTTILLYLAYGFGIDKNGRVIQNGLVFISSQPSGADIYINGQSKGQTDTRVVLPAGSYT
ncbi:MAG: PEGA domain-containing protein, partial [Candidatus Saccharimonadales bacterium]